MKQVNSIKIIIADTAFIIRKGLKTLIQENEKFEYLGEANDIKALQHLLNSLHADVLVVDHSKDESFSIEAIQNIKKENPYLNILVISHEKSLEEIKKIINIGIKNYLLKDCSEQEITDALIACAKGKKYFCGQIIDLLLEKELSPDERCETGSISDREIEVIKELVMGKRPKEIAARMNLSYHTIVTHKRNIYSKLRINNSIELAQYAIKAGLMNKP